MFFQNLFFKVCSVFHVPKQKKPDPQPIDFSKLRDGNSLRVIPFSEFFNACSNEISAVKRVAGISPEVFDDLLLPTIEQAAMKMFLLPASAAHHHREAGGLFLHSLEVGRSCLLMATGNVWDLSDDPGTRRKQLEKFYVVAFLAGLFHDLGKISTDFTVHCGRSGERWPQRLKLLSPWCENLKTDLLQLNYTNYRKDLHTNANYALALDIMPKDLKLWLSEEGEELEMLLDFLSGQEPVKRNSSMLRDNVEKADGASVQNYIARTGEQVRLGWQLFQIITLYLFEQKDEINNAGSKVWHLRQGVFIVWPDACADFFALMPPELKKYYPYTPENLMRQLHDFGHVETFLSSNNEKQILWPFSPNSLSTKGKSFVLHGLKVSINPDIFRYLPPPLDGLVGDGLEKDARPTTQKGSPDCAKASVVDEVLHFMKKKGKSSISKADLKAFLEENSQLKMHEFLWEVQNSGFSYRLENDEIFIER